MGNTPVRIIRETEHLRTYSSDKRGAGGAHHEYRICGTENWVIYNGINFQNGAIKENGVNGIQQEELLAIVIDRLECFQAGDFACEANQVALDHARKALEALESRTRDRQKRGVEGKSVK